ncbi:MAG: PAS domain S-box protein [Nitrospira sp.]|nr:PAS domain S-box protein [Nitrospira sp.]MBS0156221.1 PAS domain S-box protein [Nitrospira sp.]MBS0165582.1 PAS domain S-box protein [Nitrospira sp.]
MNNYVAKVVIAAVLMLTIVSDALTPLGVAVWVGYVFAVLLTLWDERPSAPYVVAGVATVLLPIGFVLSRPGTIELWVAIFNRVACTAYVWIMASLVVRVKQSRLDDATRRLGAIVDGSDDAILSVTIGGTVMSWNAGAERIFGYSAGEMVGCSIDRILPAEDRAAGSWVYPVLRGEGNIQSYDAVRISKDGRRIDVSITMSPLKDGSGRIVGVSKIMRDIGEQKRSQLSLQQALGELEVKVQERTAELSQANRSLRDLSSRLMQVQEEERSRLARDLHDEVGQLLTALKIDLQAVQHSANGHSLGGAFTDSLGLVDRLLTQVRTLALDLRPSILDDLGLVPALRWYANRQAQRNGWTLHLMVDGVVGRVPTMIEVACFRVVQEALTNVAKYASARVIELTLHRPAQEVILVIHDDGVGFDVAAARQRARDGESMGLFGMEERVRLAGGLLSILSEPGQGTSLELRFPLVDESQVTHGPLEEVKAP